MDKTEIQEIRNEAQIYFIPFLLGSNSRSHRLARKIYKKHKIICYILDTKRTSADIFCVSKKFLKLTKTKSSRLTSEELVYISQQSPYTLPILVPCSAEYEQIINDTRAVLEASFVISSVQDILTSSPLNVIP